MDNLTKKQRSLCMSKIRRSNTKLEVLFRKHIWKMGMRGYRIDAAVDGRPDIYFPRKKIAVFIDGCFWHKCPKCFIRPKSKNKYWDKKIKHNVKRDREVDKKLKKQGIAVLRFWGHELKKNINKCVISLKKCYEKR